MNWMQFENDVAEIFKALGYQIEQDVYLKGRQFDIVAIAPTRLKSIILIECKFHEDPTSKVEPDEIDSFINKVKRLRDAGKVDYGFLVTNSGFTNKAKDAISDYRYLHLSTYKYLFEELIDIRHYLSDFVTTYEQKQSHKKFVDLWVSDASVTSEIKFDYSFVRRSADQSSVLIDQALSIHTDEELPAEISDAIYYTENFLKKFTNKTSGFLRGSNQMQLLLGDFGSGKSTCLHHLMYQLARKKLKTENPEIPIPLLINLKEYAVTRDFDSLYINFFRKQLGYTNIDLSIFKKLNEAGRFILLFDGFDEMAMEVDKRVRKHTFMEICKQLTPKNKIILTGRPGYFPENDEMLEVLKNNIEVSGGGYYLWRSGARHEIPDKLRIGCLQLMDDIQILEYFKKNFRQLLDSPNNLLSNEKIKDLARRPVLANMIIDTADILQKLPADEINLFKVYNIYTSKWINTEEKKGRFRLLIDSDRKRFFISSLASQMYLNNETKIHYSKLDERIKAYFQLTESDKLDYFSHDIRTCTFLRRDEDAGIYEFIHRSFMEYFIAIEFMRFRPFEECSLLFRKFTDDIIKFIEVTETTPKGFATLHDALRKIKRFQSGIEYDSLADDLKNYYRKLTEYVDEFYPKYENVPSLESEIKKFEKRVIEYRKTYYR